MVEWPWVGWYVKACKVVDDTEEAIRGVGKEGDVGVVWVGACESPGNQGGGTVVRPLGVPLVSVGDDVVY